MVNKKVVFIVTMITMVIVGALVGDEIISFKYGYLQAASSNTVSSNVVESTNTKVDDTNSISSEEENVTEASKTKEDVEEDTKKEENTVNKSSTEKEENSVTNTSVKKESTKTNDTSEKKANNEEKAKDLAKKEWGANKNDVYYYVEEKVSENVYIISVRSKSSTAELIEYEVNVQKGTVTEY